MPAYKPKARRSHLRPICHRPQPAPPAPKDDELPTTAAPSHLGAVVTLSGPYLPRARGGFGFVQTG